MAKWYAAHNLTPADDNSLQTVPNPGDYTDLVTGDYCFVELEDLLHLYKYDSTSATTQDLPTWVTPDGNTGNGRWELIQTYKTTNNGFDVKQGPPTDSTISFTDGTLTFSIQPTATSFDYYIDGIRYTSEGDTVVITDVEGLHWIYFDTDGDLKVRAPGGSTDDLILEKCLVGNVYWNATDNESILVGEERHGNDMSAATHYHFHEAIGALYESGLSLTNFDIDGNGNDATAAQFDVTDGEFHDEDIEISIEDGSPQQLVNATIPTFYRLGVGGLWRKLDATANYPVADGTIGDELDWNDYNGGTWQLVEVGNLNYVLTHYFATNDIDTPIIGIMGQAEYTNINTARTGAEDELASISLAGLPGAEYLPIATVIWQTSTTYGNQVAARIRSTDLGDDYIDWRQSPISGGSSTPSDHESLANLFGGAPADHFHLTEVQHDDLTDGGDTTLHDHDGISENSTHRSGDGSDHADVAANTAASHTRLHAVTDVLDHSAGNWKVMYSNGSGALIELALDTSGKVLTSNGAASAPTFETPASGFASGTKMYFYQDTAPTDWTIDAAVADTLLAVKGGSNAYNTTGGTQAGSWTPSTHIHTMPSHIHTMPSHSHTMGTHNHRWYDYRGTTSDDLTYNSTGSTQNVQGTANSGYDKIMVHDGTIGGSSVKKMDQDSYTNKIDPGDTSLKDPGDTNSTDPGDTNSTDPGDTNAGSSPSTDRPLAAVGIIATKD